jgi:hypothetical protein
VDAVIRTVRGQKVILDTDLARIYGVPTFRLNEAVKRNSDRFPSDFLFHLAPQEVARLTSQIAMSKVGRGGRRTLPFVFTEHGAIMAATVLNSPRAIHMSLFVVRAFVKMRKELLSRAEMEARLAQVESILLAHDEHIREIYEKIRPLLLPAPDSPEREVTGFRVRERKAVYRVSRARRS